MNPHIPAEPWTSSPAFLSFLNTLPVTAVYEKHLRGLKKKQDAELAEIRAQQAEEEELRRIREEAERKDPTRPRKSWHEGRRTKHVVKGRLHLIEDDDEKGRTGYVEMNRFAFDDRGCNE